MDCSEQGGLGDVFKAHAGIRHRPILPVQTDNKTRQQTTLTLLPPFSAPASCSSFILRISIFICVLKTTMSLRYFSMRRTNCLRSARTASLTTCCRTSLGSGSR